MNNLFSKYSLLILFTGICLLSGLLFSFISFGVASWLYDIPFAEVGNIATNKSSEHFIEVIRIVLFFNSIGVFIAPPLLFTMLVKESPISFFKLQYNSSFKYLVLMGVLLFSFLPIINVCVELNKQMVLPEFLNQLELWMKASEESAMKTTKALLIMENKTDLLVNLILIAIIPAVGEELTFRGVVQQVFTRNTNNHHWAIWISAIIFSAIHFQFYGFLPRMLLGAFFGYLYFWTKSLWFPIVAHFLNNATAVIAAYYLGIEGMEKSIDKVGTTNDTYIFSVASLFFFTAFLLYFRKKVSVKVS